MFSGSLQPLTADRGSGRADNPVIQLVGFRLDNEDYAIAITKIQEIILMKPITRIPQVPDFIEGLINLRGSVIPIVNLRKRFGLPPARSTTRPARSWSTSMTRRWAASSTPSPRSCGSTATRSSRRRCRVLAVAHQYIAGLARLDDRLLIILDIERLFEAEELAAAVSSATVASA